MTDTCYIALLRGINVGGNNIVKMTELKACFQNLGFDRVLTYIQSGNIVFSSKTNNISELTSQIEKVLSETFNYQSSAVLVSRNQLKKTVKQAPAGFGESPDKYRYDVLFLKKPLTANEAVKCLNPRPGIDKVDAGDGVLYFSRLIAKTGQSYLNKFIALPVYKQTTIRNWNTTTKLLALTDQY